MTRYYDKKTFAFLSQRTNKSAKLSGQSKNRSLFPLCHRSRSLERGISFFKKISIEILKKSQKNYSLRENFNKIPQNQNFSSRIAQNQCSKIIVSYPTFK